VMRRRVDEVLPEKERGAAIPGTSASSSGLVRVDRLPRKTKAATLVSIHSATQQQC
jgi:hypothetical protein